MGDGVAEQTTMLVLTCTIAGSIFGYRLAPLFGQVTVYGGRLPFPNQAWQKPMGAQLKILPNRRPKEAFRPSP